MKQYDPKNVRLTIGGVEVPPENFADGAPLVHVREETASGEYIAAKTRAWIAGVLGCTLDDADRIMTLAERLSRGLAKPMAQALEELVRSMVGEPVHARALVDKLRRWSPEEIAAAAARGIRLDRRRAEELRAAAIGRIRRDMPPEPAGEPVGDVMRRELDDAILHGHVVIPDGYTLGDLLGEMRAEVKR